VTSLVIVLLFVTTSVGHAASSFYWYGENNSTCWQSGQPGAPHTECDSVGAGYLPTPGGYSGGLAHMLEDTAGGIGEDFKLSPSGDYCSYYRIGGPVLTSQDSTNEGAVSGLSMPTPYSSYQEGDKAANAYNACQADGTYWGQVLHGPSGKGCATGATCGMHHYVSFKSQNGNNRPWSSAFGEPSLVLSAEAGITTVAPSGSYGGWGYVCPELEDTSSHGVLEYCFEEWRSAHDAAEWKNERKGECNNPFAQVVTYFWPGTSYATEMSGSTNTFEVGSTGSGHFEAKITPTNLQNAIKLINTQCSGWHLSENPEAYALIGVEQGMEGWSGVTTLGGWGANLQLHTEYTPRTEYAQLAPASSTWAVVNSAGTNMNVFYENTSAQLDNEYWKVESPGSGWAGQMLASGVAGTPTVVENTAGNNMNVFYENTSGQLVNEYWKAESPGNGWAGQVLASNMAGIPAAVENTAGNNMNVFYRNTSGQLVNEYWKAESPGNGWANQVLASGMAGTPAAVENTAGNNMNVFYENTSGQLVNEYWKAESPGNGWAGQVLASNMAGIPAAVENTAGNNMNVFYRNTSGQLVNEYWKAESPGNGWANQVLTGGMAGP
jgi:hypothetical protein